MFKRTLVTAVVLSVLLSAGLVQAAGRDGSRDRSSGLSVTNLQKTEQAASWNFAGLLRVRLLRALELLRALRGLEEEAREEPLSYGTNGLSDGPDPIDGSGQAGDDQSLPTNDEPKNQHQDDGAGQDDSSNFGIN
jgi:hypothetical protein